MTWFVLVAAIMLVVAVATVVPWILRRSLRARRVAGHDLRRVYRERLAELEAERERGNLSETGFSEAREELEREVLEDADRAGEASAVATAGPARATGAVIAVLVPVVTVAVYTATGRPDLVGSGSTDRLSSQAAQRYAGMEPGQRIPALEDYVDKRPQAPRAWRLLGEAYLAQQEFGDAYSALQRARREGRGEDAGLIARQAEALLMANDRRFTRGVRRLVDKALDVDARQPLALLLAGHADMAAGQTQQAVDHWRALADAMPEGDSNRRAVEQMIARAQNGTAAAASGNGGQNSAEAATDAGGARVAARVRLGDGLAGDAPADAPVFVFARPAGADGGPPVAVMRTRVDALPAEITLTDEQAMVDGRNLSQAGRVVVTARVASSGDVRPQPGDLEGSSAPVAVGADARTRVVIDRVIGDGAADGSSAAPSAGAEADAGDGSAAEAAQAGSDTGAAGVSVQVRLASGLRESASADTPVFVFARAAGDGGGGPPLAVARSRVGALPARITLTDDDAMTSARKLSQAARVRIVARASLSGGVRPQSGDLQGESGAVAVGPDANAAVTIDQRIP